MTQSAPSWNVAPAESGALEWTCDPWRENARVAGLSASAAFGCCVLLATLREPFLVFAGLCLFVFAAFSPAFTPVRCRADRTGVARRGWLGWERRGWAEVRRLELLPAAVLCSPFAAKHPLDAARALALPVPAAERERCFAALQELRRSHAG
ncbi:MAG: hypothetical protein U0704_12185 [Candidatus Eisenbacteria bacterium]